MSTVKTHTFACRDCKLRWERDDARPCRVPPKQGGQATSACRSCNRACTCVCSAQLSLGELSVYIEELLDRDYDQSDPEVFAEIGDDIKTLAAGMLSMLKQQETGFFGKEHVYDNRQVCMRCLRTAAFNRQNNINACPQP